MRSFFRPLSLLTLALLSFSAAAQETPPVAKPQPTAIDTTRGDALFARYFERETAKLEADCLSGIKSLDDWKSRRVVMQLQLHKMLGLSPMPEKTDLKVTVTGRVEHPDFIVEKLHYQSSPGLYVTGNLYLPRDTTKPAPAILYVCGHGKVTHDGKSMGNKTHYQHHGGWLAKNGYVCLVIDTIQLGELEGIHHGTYREGMWWWLSRGYTPAGVEAWNCVRGIDLLESRKEVDGEKIGVTGRSGGGAYSWWIAAIDERIKVAIPTAGITDLRNHVVDGCVEGHCDCMFMVNIYRWDYPAVAAMIAPRPLLIANTDSDPIFPLDGVVRTFDKVRSIYKLYDKADNLGLNITSGGHVDTQELQVTAIRWLDVHLRGESRPILNAAEKYFEPPTLKVFETLPADEITTKIHDTFVPLPPSPAVPQNGAQWNEMTTSWQAALKQLPLRNWPASAPTSLPKPVFDVSKEGVRFRAIDFLSEEDVPLRMYIAHRAGLEKFDLAVLQVLGDSDWSNFLATYRVGFEEQLREETLPPADAKSAESTTKMFAAFPWVMCYVAPRGVGPTAFNQTDRKQIQNRRRFYLLGQTLELMQAWDIRRAMQTIRSEQLLGKTPLWIEAHGPLASTSLYAAFYEPPLERIDLHDLPTSHATSATPLLGVQQILDLPQTVAMVATQSPVVIYGDETPWSYPREVAKSLGWNAKQLQFRKAAP